MAASQPRHRIAWRARSSSLATGLRAGVDNPTGDLEIFSINPKGTELNQITFNNVDDKQPTLSPGGSFIAYSSLDTTPDQNHTDPDEEIYAISTDGTGQVNLTDNPSGDTDLSDDSAPDWFPDTSRIRIAYTRLDPSSERLQIYELSFNGFSFVKTPLSNGITDLRPDYSPDGTKIVCDNLGESNSNEEGDFEVYVMNVQDGSGKKNLTRNKTDDFMPEWSPSGKKIVYTKLSSNTWAESGGNTNRSPVNEPGRLFTMKANGSGKSALRNTSKTFINQSPDWGSGS